MTIIGVVPNFSMTADSATGKIIDTPIADVGEIREKSSFKRGKKEYITSFRVRKVQDLCLARHF